MTWLSQILSNRVRGWAMRVLQSLVNIVVGFAPLSHPTGFLRMGRAERSPSTSVETDLCVGRRRAAFTAGIFAAALGDACRFAPAAAQVIELGAAHIAAAHDLDRGDARRVEW